MVGLAWYRSARIRMASIGFGSSVFLALVLTHSSCAEETVPCFHLVAERVDISTGGALVVDVDGGGAANFIFSHSSSAARAAVVFGCRRRGSDGDSMCDLAHGGDICACEASSGWQPRLRSESAVSLEAAVVASASYRLCSSCALAVDGDAAGASASCGGVRQAKRRARVAWSPLARSLDREHGAVIHSCRQTDSVTCSSGCRFIGRFFRACCASL